MNALWKSALVTAVLAIGISACSDRRTKSNSNSTKSTDTEQAAGSDRSSSLEYTGEVHFLDGSAESGADTLSTVRVAVADEEQERNEGLMNVTELPEDRGMYFVFPEQEPLSFWMANTPLALDIIFVNESREIVRIHHSTNPYSQESFTSGEPARYVVEVNGGFCVSHDIREGMRVVFEEG